VVKPTLATQKCQSAINKYALIVPSSSVSLKETDMDGSVSILITAIGACASITALIIVARTLFKGPRVTFSLKKTDISFYNQENTENITLLFAPIVNPKRWFLGDTAKKLSGLVLYRAPSDENWPGLNASIGLPWLKTFEIRIRIDEQLKSKEGFQKTFETCLFDRKEKDIPQGRGECLAVAYGVERLHKLFLASDPSIEIPLPSGTDPQTFNATWLRLEVAGENLKSSQSEGTMILARDWKNWTYPTAVMTLYTPSKLRNLLLLLGFGRKKKVLESK
jgi:hypothetical protein